MKDTELELEEGWVIIHHNSNVPSQADQIYLLRHRCHNKLNITEQRGHGISPVKVAGQTYCPACSKDTPDEVIGFFNLCKWGTHHGQV